MAVIDASAFAAVAALPLPPATRSAAILGVGLSIASGAVALWVKALAMRTADGMKALQHALFALGVGFGVRLLTVLVGILVVKKESGLFFPFVFGFFGVYLATMWIELALVSSSSRQHTGETRV